MIRDTTSGGYYSIDRKAVSLGRRIKLEATVESLAGDGAAGAVALLLNPMLRLFDGWEVGAEFIRKAASEAC